jgi:hypothetical protein
MNEPSATAILTAFGLGKYAAGIVSIMLGTIAFLAHVIPYLPVASATSPKWYATFYGLLAWITGNYGANSATPTNGLPAGGIVPAPPIAPATAATTKP